jgi:hypothetical protein
MQQEDIDAEWALFWANEGYSIKDVGAAPKSKRKRRTFFRYRDWVQEDAASKKQLLADLVNLLKR